MSCISAATFGAKLDSICVVQDGGYSFARDDPFISPKLLEEDPDQDMSLGDTHVISESR